MSENVNEIMERMVPDLQDLESNSVFSHEEIASIIRKRRTMEYAIYSHTRKIDDYVNAIEYEVNLETLRKIRKRKLGLTKPLISDYSVQKRILYTFERMVRRYPGNLNAWLKFVEYCESTGNQSRLSGLYPRTRILQLHPREEAIWVKAANYEMSIGNVTNARTFLQRAIRMNKHSTLLWKEYFRFELAYINLIEERRRVLGLSSLRDKLDVNKDDSAIQKSIENELQKDADDVSLTTEASNDNEIEASENQEIVHEDDTSKTKEIDDIVTSQSEEAQAMFLKGAIPKVVYTNAMKECNDSQFALSFLEISYELDNRFVEKFVLDDILENFGNDLSIWRSLLGYPVSRVSAYINSNDEEVVKKHRMDIEECTSVCDGLAKIAISKCSVMTDVSEDLIYGEIIGGLTDCYKVLRVIDPECNLASTIGEYIDECKEKELMTSSVIKEVIAFYAVRGEIEKCIELIHENESLLSQSLTFFDYCCSILVSTYTRSPEIITSVFGCHDPANFVIQFFEKGINTFKQEKDQEGVLKVYVRFIKFLILIPSDEKKIQTVFKKAFEVKPELNASVYLLYLSWSNENGIERAREAIDFAFANEVLIPLDEEVLGECLDVEKRYMASLEETQVTERERSIARMEKVYDVYCKRYNQDSKLWIDYIVFERRFNRYMEAQRIYNRAVHYVKDVSSFEEKYNLLQIKGHLWCVCCLMNHPIDN